MQNNLPKVYTIILNWNGDKDTISLLESLSEIDYFNNEIVLVDNGSKSESYNRIFSYLEESIYFNLHSQIELLQDDLYLTGKGNKISMLKSNINLGFAKGCNAGIKFAIDRGGEYILLLNNDTEVNKDFLTILMRKILANPELGAVIPQIRYFANKEIIWNCGGNIKFGFRKYFFANRSFIELNKKKEIAISFATGCALLFKPLEVGTLSEQFFFGEEDFEFAYRMKRLRKKMICVLDSVIYHKVGQSINRNEQSINKGAIFIYYLNRFINMKYQFKSIFLWKIWRFIYAFYIFAILYKKFTFNYLINFLLDLFDKSNKMTKVSKDDFDLILKNMNKL